MNIYKYEVGDKVKDNRKEPEYKFGIIVQHLNANMGTNYLIKWDNGAIRDFHQSNFRKITPLEEALL